ncbi:MAG: hypothetical protein ACRC6B_06780, partial [Fusobacteriaceae bacterium]
MSDVSEKIFCSLQELGIDYKNLMYVDAEDMKEAKAILKEGVGIIIDEKRVIYYCEDYAKLFILTFEYAYGKTSIREVSPTKLIGKVVSIDEAEELLENNFEAKRQEINRIKEHKDWL